MNTEEGNKLIADGYKILDGGFVIGKRGNFLKLHKGTSGYIQLNIGRKETQETFLVHRLVAQLYVPNPMNLPEVNHDNGIKDCNWSWNLKWCTRPENIQHGYDMGLITKHMIGKSGSKHHLSKPVFQIDLANNILNEYGSAKEAARLSKINYGTISNVLIGKGKTAGGFIWEYKK